MTRQRRACGPLCAVQCGAPTDVVCRYVSVWAARLAPRAWGDAARASVGDMRHHHPQRNVRLATEVRQCFRKPIANPLASRGPAAHRSDRFAELRVGLLRVPARRIMVCPPTFSPLNRPRLLANGKLTLRPQSVSRRSLIPLTVVGL
ncbi:hypothetical protein OG21DRAFT_536293 [Imleria badia]|nr:hypothetical protein OG21DRAFT_536293 [Imleria badia]